MKNTVVEQAKILQKRQCDKPRQQSNWQKLINGILRPPRSHYKQSSLGSHTFVLNQTKYERKDIVIGHQDKTITLTVFQPQYKSQWVILYLHGNSSSRLQCTSIIKHLPYRFSLASFDFIGCGQNHESDVISLGVRESQQVETVVSFLQQNGFRVMLWGRSMGAATALKFGKAPIIVADSSFKSFKSLCKQIAKQNLPKFVLGCLISCLFPCVFCKLRSDIQQKGNYDIEQLDILQDVKRISESTMIVCGDEDKLINISTLKNCTILSKASGSICKSSKEPTTQNSPTIVQHYLSLLNSLVLVLLALSFHIHCRKLCDWSAGPYPCNRSHFAQRHYSSHPFASLLI